MIPSVPPFDPNQKRNQHYVPRLWQRRFADAAGTVFARYRVSADPVQNPNFAGKARQVSVNATMAEDWAYTIFDRWWRPSNAVEEWLSEREGETALIFNKVTDQAVVLDVNDRSKLCQAMALAACRTPDVMARGLRRAKEIARFVSTVHSFPDAQAFRAKAHSAHRVDFTDADYASFFATPVEQLESEAAAIETMSPQDPQLPQQIALDAIDQISDVLLRMELSLLHATAPDHFILGDTPLPDTDLGSGFVVPISASVALEAKCSSPGSGISRRTATSSEIRAVNQRQYESSLDVVIGPERATLDAL